MFVSQMYAHIYQKPRFGGHDVFLSRHKANGYSHRIQAIGGFDSASCSLDCSQPEAEQIFYNYLGNVIQFYPEVGNVIVPAWEGFINRITYRTGDIVLTASLDAMANRVRVVYYDINNPAAQKTEISATYTVDDSINIYGVKDASIDAGIHYNTANKTHKTVLRDTIAKAMAWPQVSTANGGGSGPMIEIECLGLHYYVWDWTNYENTDTVPIAPSTLLTNILTIRPGLAPFNSSFVYQTVSSGTGAAQLIQPNTSFILAPASRSGQTHWQFVLSVVEAGDGNQQWVVGITSPQATGGVRQVYYQPASTEVKYSIRARQDVGIIRDSRGSIIPGHEVRPDAVLRIDDVIPWYDVNTIEDPTLNYLSAIEYDGDTGRVTWQTGDNITMEGALGRDRYFKRHGQKAFGAPVRQFL